MNKAEENAILNIIKQHPEQEYIASADGFWYAYNVKTKDSLNQKNLSWAIWFRLIMTFSP